MPIITFPGRAYISSDSDIDLRVSSNSIGIKKMTSEKMYLVQCQWTSVMTDDTWPLPKVTLYGGAVLRTSSDRTDFSQIAEAPQRDIGTGMALLLAIPPSTDVRQYADVVLSNFNVPSDLIIRYDVLINAVVKRD